MGGKAAAGKHLPGHGDYTQGRQVVSLKLRTLPHKSAPANWRAAQRKRCTLGHGQLACLFQLRRLIYRAAPGCDRRLSGVPKPCFLKREHPSWGKWIWVDLVKNGKVAGVSGPFFLFRTTRPVSGSQADSESESWHAHSDFIKEISIGAASLQLKKNQQSPASRSTNTRRRTAPSTIATSTCLLPGVHLGGRRKSTASLLTFSWK